MPASTPEYAVITHLGAQYIAESLVTGSFSFRVTDFVLGDQGHDPENPLLARTPDRAQTEVNDGRPTMFGPTVLNRRGSQGRNLTVGFTLGRLDAVGVFSQVCFLATVESVPAGRPDLPAVGSQFLFAVAHHPAFVKTSTREESRDYVFRF